MDRNGKSVARPALQLGVTLVLFAGGGPGCTAEIFSNDGGGPPDAMTSDASCLAGDAGSEGGASEGGAPADASEQDAIVFDAESDATVVGDAGSDASAGVDATVGADAAGTSDASPGDASESGSDSAVCATPLAIPLFGTVALTGTMTIPDTSVTPFDGCLPLTTPTPTSGTLTFQLTSGLCSFIYADQSGVSVASNITEGAVTGDTYECTFGGPTVVGPATYPGCPELSNVDDGLTADITLTVNVSTGAISLTRLCGYGDSTCTTGSYIPNDTLNGVSTTSFSLGGSISCTDVLTETIPCEGGPCTWPAQVCCAAPPVGGQTSGCISNSGVGPDSCIGGTLTGCSSSADCPEGFDCCGPNPNGTVSTLVSFCWAAGCPSSNPSL